MNMATKQAEQSIDAREVLDDVQFHLLNTLLTQRQEMKYNIKLLKEGEDGLGGIKMLNQAIKEQLIEVGENNLATPDWTVKLVGKAASRKLSEGKLQAAMMKKGIAVDVIAEVLKEGWEVGAAPEPFVDVRPRAFEGNGK